MVIPLRTQIPGGKVRTNFRPGLSVRNGRRAGRRAGCGRRGARATGGRWAAAERPGVSHAGGRGIGGGELDGCERGTAGASAEGQTGGGAAAAAPRLDIEEGKQRWERYMKAYDEKRRGGNPEVRRSGAASRRDGTDAPSAVWGAQREAHVLGRGLAGRIEAQEVETVAEPREQPADGRRRHDGEPPPPRAAAPGGRGPGTDRRGDPLWANASCARGSTAPRARRASGSSSPAWRPAARSGRRRLR